MGRVYEALKRAAEHGASSKPNGNGTNGNGSNGNGHADARAVDMEAARRAVDAEATLQGVDAEVARESAAPATAAAAAPSLAERAAQEQLLGRTSKFFHAPVDDPSDSSTARGSASTEHTGSAHVGSALSGAQALRVAGATVDAVGSARAVEFPSLEIETARVEPHLVAVTDPRSPHAEQYRSLRTRVLHAGEKRKVQALVVTSAGVMEGKTVTALNLSWLLAQTDGVRAILIDGDLRNPCADDYLGIETERGLSEVLAREAKLDDCIRRLEPSGLHLLPGGSPRDNVAELLSGPRFSAVLAELRTMFNYILIDAPPLGIFSDASVLINRADAALVVVRSGKTRYAELDRVLEPLPRERLLGVVLNGAQEQPDESNYYYQRRYYQRRETKQVMSTED